MPLTIAIPTYNRGAILVETLERLLELEPPAGEIIVVDQTREQPPHIAEKLASFPITLIRLDQPSIPHAMNVALQRAKNRVVLFVDDDVEPPRGLAAAHAAVYDDPAVWACVGQVLQPGEVSSHFDEETLRRGPLRDLEFPFNHDVATDVQNVIACNLSVDRERALSIGGFDEKYVGVAYRFETDFALRVVKAGGRVRFEPKAGLRHLRVPTGGVRAYGDHRSSPLPAHAMGDYYFARTHVPAFWRYVARRLVRNVATRWHLKHPWAIPPKLVGEWRGLRAGLKLRKRE